ncbi:MAG: calcium-binding protein [Pseudomonadota bacterium]
MTVSIAGQFGFRINGSTVFIDVARLENNTPTTTSGTLRLELWALDNPYPGSGPVNGFQLGTARIPSNDSRLGPGQFFFDIQVSSPLLNVPRDGNYFVTLFVTEFDGSPLNDGFLIVDSGNFDLGINVRDGVIREGFRTTPDPLQGSDDPTNGDDLLFGDGDADVIFGLFGDDTIRAAAGNDTLNGGGGDDDLFGQGGRDVIRGAAGNDSIVGGGQDDRLIGQGGRDTLKGGGGDDRLVGGGGRDRLIGGGGEDTLIGGGGGDRLIGGSGADRLNGGGRNDGLFGGGGADRLIGGSGDDDLTGGGGRDRFEFNGRAGDDVITDFQDGTDRIVIRAANDIGDLRITEDSAGDAVIEFRNTTITLEDIDRGQLSSSDFIF